MYSRYLEKMYGGIPHSVVANILNCNIVVSKFKLQSCYYVYFWTNALGKGMNPLIPFPCALG